MRKLSPDQARRLSLVAQGFGRSRPTARVDRRHVQRAMADMQVLQLDSVNVCVRSHYMPLFSRLGPYRAGLVDEMAYDDGRYFEYWGHEASLIPTEMYPLFGHRRQSRGTWNRFHEMMEEHPGYVEMVESEVIERGPITVGQLTDPGETTNPWWGYGKGKLALEYLFAKGRVNVARRVNFARHYDAPHRVIPQHLLEAPVLPIDQAYRALALSALRGLGVGTTADIADYWRLNVPRLRPVLEGMTTSGEVEKVAVSGWKQTAFILPGTAVPRSVNTRALLTPFDPVVWNRERTERIHGFNYRIEIYVPEPQRRFGYYVYPFLLGDRLVGRVDLKADRASGHLRVRASWIEDGEDPTRVAPELSTELRILAEWLGLNEVVVEPRGNLSDHLARIQ